MERYNIKVISTAGDNMYIFIDVRVYKRLFSANSGWLMRLPSMNTAG